MRTSRRSSTDDQTLERRMAVRAEHLANIKNIKEKGSVICAGELTNAAGKMIGSFLVMDLKNEIIESALLIVKISKALF